MTSEAGSCGGNRCAANSSVPTDACSADRRTKAGCRRDACASAYGSDEVRRAAAHAECRRNACDSAANTAGGEPRVLLKKFGIGIKGVTSVLIHRQFVVAVGSHLKDPGAFKCVSSGAAEAEQVEAPESTRSAAPRSIKRDLKNEVAAEVVCLLASSCSFQISADRAQW